MELYRRKEKMGVSIIVHSDTWERFLEVLGRTSLLR